MQVASYTKNVRGIVVAICLISSKSFVIFIFEFLSIFCDDYKYRYANIACLETIQTQSERVSGFLQYIKKCY